LVGLSDVIVDIVETGTTLRENHLRVFEEIVPISARLIANKAAGKFKSEELFSVVEKLKNRRK
ncbi:MAG: ATP phosphoribosyltransferase, partial [Eubacteriales bacterium]